MCKEEHIVNRTLKLGDYINYSPPTKTVTVNTHEISVKASQSFNPSNVKWRIFEIKNGMTYIISSENIGYFEVESTLENPITSNRAIIKSLNQIANLCADKKLANGGMICLYEAFTSKPKEMFGGRYWMLVSQNSSVCTGDALINVNGRHISHDGAISNVYKIRAGVRPIVVMKPFKITGGLGTANNPYTISQ